MIRVFVFFFLLCFTEGCSENYHAFVQYYQFKEKILIPDYNNLNYWAAHSWKKDPSDSISKPLLLEKSDSLVDVFFNHPTTYTDARPG